ncbi:hypothetical protein EGH21_22305 [Halomicroarcula sp. F13]|uniref:Uncharacterized protein n=1 Tax=Haloarcula rubra TaxID=2487747 RepID=A0AAW4PZW0_9EURY|nr:hypothetical protein [Halomicroarcula rubra]MBX0325753.1 hypothetical protein [Halomicroarcula rubra]
MSESVSLDRSGVQILRKHLDLWAELADSPDDTWRDLDVPDHGNDVFRSLQQYTSIISRERVEDDAGEPYHVFQYTEAAWVYIEDALENRETYCPCEHGGVQNRGDHYVCSYEGCDDTFDREQIDIGGEGQ